ncbi:LuxR C-terminal-related transcriptional regulator [Brevibacterium litoralis]|uniref:LuxR C-terminal-related transcriptional regulator n=1 Tax=Brevibacterium litoralis TaxID=3138935 RepID=UPI0032EADD2F
MTAADIPGTAFAVTPGTSVPPTWDRLERTELSTRILVPVGPAGSGRRALARTWLSAATVPEEPPLYPSRPSKCRDISGAADDIGAEHTPDPTTVDTLLLTRFLDRADHLLASPTPAGEPTEPTPSGTHAPPLRLLVDASNVTDRARLPDGLELAERITAAHPTARVAFIASHVLEFSALHTRTSATILTPEDLLLTPEEIRTHIARTRGPRVLADTDVAALWRATGGWLHAVDRLAGTSGAVLDTAVRDLQRTADSAWTPWVLAQADHEDFLTFGFLPVVDYPTLRAFLAPETILPSLQRLHRVGVVRSDRIAPADPWETPTIPEPPFVPALVGRAITGMVEREDPARARENYRRAGVALDTAGHFRYGLESLARMNAWEDVSPLELGAWVRPLTEGVPVTEVFRRTLPHWLTTRSPEVRIASTLASFLTAEGLRHPWHVLPDAEAPGTSAAEAPDSTAGRAPSLPHSPGTPTADDLDPVADPKEIVSTALAAQAAYDRYRREGRQWFVVALVLLMTERTRGHHERSRDIALDLVAADPEVPRDSPDSFLLAFALVQAGLTFQLMGDTELARRCYAATFSRATALGSDYLLARSAGLLALWHGERGHRDTCAGWLRRHDAHVEAVGWNRETVRRPAILARIQAAVEDLDHVRAQELLTGLPAEPDLDDLWPFHAACLLRTGVGIGYPTSAVFLLDRLERERSLTDALPWARAVLTDARAEAALSQYRSQHAAAVLDRFPAERSGHALVYRSWALALDGRLHAALEAADRALADTHLDERFRARAFAIRETLTLVLSADSDDAEAPSPPDTVDLAAAERAGAELAALRPRLHAFFTLWQVPGARAAVARGAGLTAEEVSRLDACEFTPLDVDRTRPVLSARETAMLRALAQGKSRSRIAADEVISLNTVKTQMRSAYRKLGAANKDEALAAAMRWGYL